MKSSQHRLSSLRVTFGEAQVKDLRKVVTRKIHENHPEIRF